MDRGRVSAHRGWHRGRVARLEPSQVLLRAPTPHALAEQVRRRARRHHAPRSGGGRHGAVPGEGIPDQDGPEAVAHDVEIAPKVRVTFGKLGLGAFGCEVEVEAKVHGLGMA